MEQTNGQTGEDWGINSGDQLADNPITYNVLIRPFYSDRRNSAIELSRIGRCELAIRRMRETTASVCNHEIFDTECNITR